MNSRPVDHAWDRILSNNFEEEISSTLSVIFSDGEYLETRRFSILHKTLLGLVPSSLTIQLQLSTSHINAIDGNGRTCLSWAAARGDTISTRLLLEHGANPDISDMEGAPPLFHAIRSKSKECVSMLLEHSTKHEVINVYGSTALHVASTGSNAEIMALLVKHCRVNINTINYNNNTALHSVARSAFGATARHLLNAGADVSIANVAGDTAMHIAVFWKSLDVLEELVESGASFSLLNSKGESPLHTVARECDPEIMDILEWAPSVLDVDLHAKNRDGESCFDYISGDEGKKRKFEGFLDKVRELAERDDRGNNEMYEDALEDQGQ